MEKERCVDQIGLKAHYEEREPTPQNVAALLKGPWKRLLAGGLASGTSPIFEDRRTAWLVAQLSLRVRASTVTSFWRNIQK
jgi:hypothetical protein